MPPTTIELTEEEKKVILELRTKQQLSMKKLELYSYEEKAEWFNSMYNIALAAYENACQDPIFIIDSYSDFINDEVLNLLGEDFIKDCRLNGCKSK